MRWLRLVPAGLFLPLCTCRAPSDPEANAGPVKVCVSILPQAYFVERIAGTRADVSVLVGPGQNMHTYEPTPKQVAELERARLFFRIGVPFEDRLIEKLKNRFDSVQVVDTRQGIRLRPMTCEEEHDGPHDGHDHAAGRPDPHIWLDPKLVKIQARTICDAMCRADPPGAEVYRKNCDAFLADLDAVDARIARALAPLKGKEFFVYHPAFGYFGDSYGLRQVAVETAGKEPDAKELAALIDRAKATGVKVIFVQPQFSARSARAVAEAIGGVVVPMDDLAKDYLKNLDDMAAKIEKAIR